MEKRVKATMACKARAREEEVVLGGSTSRKRKWRVEGRGHFRSEREIKGCNTFPLRIAWLMQSPRTP